MKTLFAAAALAATLIQTMPAAADHIESFNFSFPANRIELPHDDLACRGYGGMAELIATDRDRGQPRSYSDTQIVDAYKAARARETDEFEITQEEEKVLLNIHLVDVLYAHRSITPTMAYRTAYLECGWSDMSADPGKPWPTGDIKVGSAN